jgi:hypothetical protein
MLGLVSTRDDAAAHGAWATVARETFEHNVIPWAGRKYAAWVRTWSRPHPGDPTGLVQVPDPVYRAFEAHIRGQNLSRQTAEELGYPHVPGERELDQVRRDLHDALGRCDWDRAHDLNLEVHELQERVEATRLAALAPGPRGR